MGGFTFSLTDSIALSDTPLQGRGYRPGDQLQLIDDFLVELDPGHRYSLQDNLNLTDILRVAFTNSPTLSDAVALVDGASLERNFTFKGDTFSLSDAAVYSLDSIYLALAQAVFDSIVLSDSIDFFRTGNALLGDGFAFADSIQINLRSISTSYLRRYLNDV